MTDHYDLLGVPAADSVQMFVCDNCKHVHFAFIGANSKPIAVASLDLDGAESLARELLDQLDELRE